MAIIEGIIMTVISSICASLINFIVSRRGKLCIYYKRESISPDLYGCGMFGDNLVIPMVFDLQNTSGVNKVCRDLSLWLCCGSTKISKFQQIGHTYQENDKTKEISNKHEFGNKARIYSFVINPKSITSVRCFFMIKQSKIDSRVNNISLSYYDQRNNYHLCNLFNINEFKNGKKVSPDQDWVEVK